MDSKELVNLIKELNSIVSTSFELIIVGGAALILHFGARMEDKINKLFSEWNRLGAAVLVAILDSNIVKRQPEDIISESTNLCRFSGRLTWIVIDWLIKHIDEVDDRLLLEKTKSKGNYSVLGLL